MRIYLDMDGTIADLYQGTWLNDIINENVRPYANAKRLISEKDLMKWLDLGYDFGIISWTAKNGSKEYNKAVRKAKIKWLKENYPNIKFNEIHIVKYGTPKHYVANLKHQILIDDEKPNRDSWLGYSFAPECLL